MGMEEMCGWSDGIEVFEIEVVAVSNYCGR